DLDRRTTRPVDPCPNAMGVDRERYFVAFPRSDREHRLSVGLDAITTQRISDSPGRARDHKVPVVLSHGSHSPSGLVLPSATRTHTRRVPRAPGRGHSSGCPGRVWVCVMICHGLDTREGLLLLQRECDLEQRAFVAVGGGELHADWYALGRQSGGQREGGCAGDVVQWCERDPLGEPVHELVI